MVTCSDPGRFAPLVARRCYLREEHVHTDILSTTEMFAGAERVPGKKLAPFWVPRDGKNGPGDSQARSAISWPSLLRGKGSVADQPSGSSGSGRRSRGGSFPSRQSVEGDPRNKGDGSGEPTGAAGARGCEHPAEPGARRAGTGDRGRASGATESPGRGAGPLPRVVSGPGSLGKQAPASRDVPSAATTLARRHERRAARGSRRPDGRGRTPGAAESTGRGAGQPPRVSSGPGEPGTASLGVPRRAVCH